jgi:uncharacterized protein (TIGR03086 family)
VHLESGPLPAAVWIQQLTTELTVHAWDLASATGGDTELEGELVTAALVVAENVPETGVPDKIDPALEVSDAAPPQSRLLARFGRKG